MMGGRLPAKTAWPSSGEARLGRASPHGDEDTSPHLEAARNMPRTRPDGERGKRSHRGDLGPAACGHRERACWAAASGPPWLPRRPARAISGPDGGHPHRPESPTHRLTAPSHSPGARLTKAPRDRDAGL